MSPSNSPQSTSFNLKPWLFTGWATAIILLGSVAKGGEDRTEVTNTKHGVLDNSPCHVHVGETKLPALGHWRIVGADANPAVRELYLQPNQSSRLRHLGSRMFVALKDRQIRNGRWQLRMGYEACRQYAVDHDGVGPQSCEDFEEDERWKHTIQQWEDSYRGSGDIIDLIDENPIEGPFVHLIPEAKFQFSPVEKKPTNRNQILSRSIVKKEDRNILAFEVRPFVDDGSHWVLYTDGQCERLEIDDSLVRAQGAEIRPILHSDELESLADSSTLTYQVVMVSDNADLGHVDLRFQSEVADEFIEVRWDLQSGKVMDASDTEAALSAARKHAWKPYLNAAGGGVLQVWQQGGDHDLPANPPRNLSMFSVLGGRAAVEETLQLQSLRFTPSEEEANIDVDSLEGVKVQSHPFQEMLGDQTGGSLELARYMPADRLFVYVGKPESIPALLDKGAPFIATLGTALSGNCLQYNLEARYLERLGMSRDWVDSVLASGMTSELAVSAPDLFFIDGTDLTLVAKLRYPKLLHQMIGMLGVSGLTDESILELPTHRGGSAYLALRDDLLFASTNRDEIQLSLDLYDDEGKGSLGESVEFRYMLTQLDVTKDTRFYGYLSDPFVRRLVSPRVKIGQRRRILAKAKMEALTATWLRARLDGYAEGDAMPESVRRTYLPQNWDHAGTSIDASGMVRSEHYGRLPRMKTLPEVPLKNVTPAEAEAYKEYLENYSRYWRRFFDPIAIRLEEVGNKQLELSTFILPLVDNSIYNGLRSVLAHQDDGSMLSIPVVEPTPVVQFSANLNETAWAQVAGNFSEFFTRYSGASPAMLDDFGPSLHVAIFDADPIIAMGSGDVFGAFGGNVLRGGGNQMVMLPIALSMLTRPCSILVETKSPKKTSLYLRQAALSGFERRNFGGFQSSFYQVGERDEWVWTMDIFGVVKLRYGVEVVGNYMVIRNIPWSSDDRVIDEVTAPLNASMLQANPAACKLQLQGLFAAAADGNRKAVMSGLGRLYPFMLSGADSVDHAMKEHQRLYGFYPRTLGNDQWEWKDFRMVSQQYGKPAQQKQPAFDPDQPFGMMNQIESLKLNMQFEQDGLRSSIQWSLR